MVERSLSSLGRSWDVSGVIYGSNCTSVDGPEASEKRQVVVGEPLRGVGVLPRSWERRWLVGGAGEDGRE